MSAGFAALGPDAQIRINGAVFAVTEGNFTDSADITDTTDSEATSGVIPGGAKSSKPGLYQFTCNLSAQRATDVNPFVGPLYLAPGYYIHLAIYPDGISNSIGHDIPFFLIESNDGSFAVQGSPAQTVRLNGRSVGGYYQPGGGVVGVVGAGVPTSVLNQSDRR